MSKMNELSIDEQETAYAEYVEEQHREIGTAAVEAYKAELLRKMSIELSWKTTDEAFRAGIEWVRDQVLETGRI
jgi:hypothetical protein